MKAVIHLAGPYDDKLTDRIKAGFDEMYKCRLEYEIVPDDKAAGGFIAYIDGKAYDCRLSTKLSQIRKSILS